MPIKINIIEILTVGIEISFIFGDSLSYLLGTSLLSNHLIRSFLAPKRSSHAGHELFKLVVWQFKFKCFYF